MSEQWDLSFLGAAPSGGWGGQGGGGRPTHGLNVDVCQDIAFGLGHDSRTLAEVIDEVDVAVRKVRDEWHGPDAERWQAGWHAQRRHLTEAAEGLAAMRRRLELDIDDQQRTSRS
jgi:hypothetical protein